MSRSPAETTAAANVVGGLEALLFVSSRPLTVSELASLLELEAPLVEAALEQLQEQLDRSRGLTLRRIAGGVQLVTRPEYADTVARLFAPRQVNLSNAGLEVLAIVAYQQPVTRAEIDEIRGVKSERAVRTLVEYGLIEPAGRKDAPGRPALYRTTERFLRVFGLNDLTDLPPLESFRSRHQAKADAP